MPHIARRLRNGRVPGVRNAPAPAMPGPGARASGLPRTVRPRLGTHRSQGGRGGRLVGAGRLGRRGLPGGRSMRAGRPRSRASPRFRHGGFTLVELAVVIAVVGFLLGAFLAPLSARIEAARVRETERMLVGIRDALIGYAMTRGALPCPDTVADGIDGAAPATCAGTALAGVLPFQALGVPPADAWGRYFEYRVTEEFTNRALTGQPPAAGRLDLTDTGDVTVLARGDDPSTGGTTELKHQSAATALTRSAPAVVLSAGPNGFGGIAAATGTALAAPGGGAADETENADGDATFVSRTHSRGAATCDDADETATPPPPLCEFDDVVAWVSTPALMAGLVQARVLP